VFPVIDKVDMVEAEKLIGRWLWAPGSLKIDYLALPSVDYGGMYPAASTTVPLN
jgi:hypothetical protein